MKKLAVGIMSGTSLDGIDVVIAEISGSQKETILNQLAFHTIPFDKQLRSKIEQCFDIKTSGIDLVCSLNFELAVAFANAVKETCTKENISLSDIRYIASHGQTVYHITKDSNETIKSSLQLGDGSVIANLCNVTTVSNFRTADIAAGGEGAPLVPYYDYIMYSDDSKSKVLCNIGGISNMTYLRKNGTLEDVIAFDSGPGNMMIDYAMESLFNQKYDDQGVIARSGSVIPDMMTELLKNEFLVVTPPKSTGRELYGTQYTKTLIQTYQAYKKEDIVTTLTKFTALSIYQAYNNFIAPTGIIDELMISGGGAYNTYLLELLQEVFIKIPVNTMEQKGFDSDSKEALAFLVLGNETLLGNTSNVPSATGANKSVILGQISYIK